MKRLRKTVSVIAALSIVTTGVFAGCGKKSEVEKNNVEKKVEETTKLKWYVFGAKQQDHDVVMAELNKKLKEKINVELDLQVIDAGTFEDKMRLIVSANEDYDLTFTSNWRNKFNDNMGKGAFKALDELIDKNAPKLKTALPASLLEVAKVNGKTYAVPNYQIIYQSWGVNFQKELVDKYKFDLKTVKTIRDIEPFLENIKKNEPNLIPFRMFGGTASFPLWYLAAEEIVSEQVVIKQGDKSLKAISLFDLKEDKENRDLNNDWFQKGYARKDAVTVTDDSADQKANKYAAFAQSTKPGGDPEISAKWGKEYVSVAIQKPYITAQAGNSTMTAINANSKNPEKAIKLIELVNTDKDVYNNLIFGNENTHYKKISNDTVEVPADSKYKMGTSAWMFGNQFNALYMKGQQSGIWEETDKLNKSADVSVLRGFTFDPSPVSSEIAKVGAVVKEYKVIDFLPDREKRYEEYKTKAYAAGLQKVIDEVQKQIDTWAKANGKK